VKTLKACVAIVSAVKVWGSAAVAVVALTAAAWGTAGSDGTKAPAAAPNLCQARSVTPPRGVTDTYDRKVLSLGPIAYLTLGSPSAATEPDLSGHHHAGVYMPANDAPARATLPNGDTAAQFDGQRQYLQVPSAAGLSVTHSGSLTVEAWVRPKTLQFPHEQGSGYVYILGKGTAGKQEYALRMYSKSNSETPVRPNRISAYAFNLPGGIGSGSYFQDKVRAGQWMMVAFEIRSTATTGWPHGYVAIYKNGSLRGQVSLSQFNVKPKNANAPFRIGTRDLESYFEGAIGKVAVYDYILSPADLQATYKAMS
jgi:hypothetical protein